MNEMNRNANRPRVDGKSLLVGLALGVLPLAVIGAQRAPAADEKPRFPKYQVAAWSDGAGDRHGAFVVNTETGELVAVLGRSYVSGKGIAAEHAVQNVKR